MGAARAAFFEKARGAGADIVVLDIPLLLETGGERAVDLVVVVSASAEVQKARVLARPGMTETKFDAIFAAQMPDAEKRTRADFIVDTGLGLQAARDQVARIVATLRARAKQPN
jgi:dephospho-CoA kinase